MATRVAFITGGSSDIGIAIRDILTQHGWTVTCPSHDELDLSDLKAVRAYAEQLKNDSGQIDAIIHVAGIWHEGDKVLADRQLGTFSPEQITQTMNVGITSIMVLLNAWLPSKGIRFVIGISGTFPMALKVGCPTTRANVPWKIFWLV